MSDDTQICQEVAITDQELVDYQMLHFWLVHAHPGEASRASHLLQPLSLDGAHPKGAQGAQKGHLPPPHNVGATDLGMKTSRDSISMDTAAGHGRKPLRPRR